MRLGNGTPAMSPSAHKVNGAGLPRGLAGRLSMSAKLAIAMLLALHPVTAVLTLGWLIRLMRRETAIALAMYGFKIARDGALERLAQQPELAGMVRFPGWWKGLWHTVLRGVAASLALAAATLPFGLPMLLSWWAGWENSFNKGYEQAWVGPALAFAGIAIAVAVLSHLPMALAHFAVEGRIGAITEIGAIRRLIGRVRWRYAALSLATVILSLPLVGMRVLPTFVESVRPDTAALGADALAALGTRWHVWSTVYLVAVLFVVRRWAARVYARAVLLEAPEQARVLLANAQVLRIALPLAGTQQRGWPARGRLGGIAAGLLVMTGWLAFVLLGYVAQFANHAWWNWINNPMTALPWVFRPL